MPRPLYETHQALRDLLELTESLMAEAGRKPAPDGAVSKAKTALHLHEAAANAEYKSDLAKFLG